eukprot:scaffold276611_cov40-Tisochrysis_lutea.AAC.1
MPMQSASQQITDSQTRSNSFRPDSSHAHCVAARCGHSMVDTHWHIVLIGWRESARIRSSLRSRDGIRCGHIAHEKYQMGQGQHADNSS